MRRKATWVVTKELLLLFVVLVLLVGAGTTGSTGIVATSSIEGTTGTAGTCGHDLEWRRSGHRRPERRHEHSTNMSTTDATSGAETPTTGEIADPVAVSSDRSVPPRLACQGAEPVTLKLCKPRRMPWATS